MARTLEELIKNEDPKVVERAGKKAENMLFDIRLAELRERTQKTQNDMAKALGIKQPTVASLEKPGRDPKLSTLKRYVEATGSKLRIDIELPDGSHFGFPL
ncbi:helix-turn-helix transcriptional regulator [Desulfatiferula olefinivorans]|jgi:DNA-binding XRE family transcriptional regulator